MPVLRDRVCDGRTHSDWSEVHHEVRELEHGLGKALREIQHRPPAIFTNQGKRNAKQDAEHDDLKNLPLGNCLREILGKDVQDRFARAELLRLKDSPIACGGHVRAHSRSD